MGGPTFLRLDARFTDGLEVLVHQAPHTALPTCRPMPVAGVIPIYIGAPDVNRVLPVPEAIIRVEDFARQGRVEWRGAQASACPPKFMLEAFWASVAKIRAA